MNSKTRIIVIQCKQLIIALFISILALALIAAISIIISSSSKKETPVPSGKYAAGVYSSAVTLNGNPVEVRVTVDEDNINDIELVNVSESVTTMYPLIQSSFNEIKELVIENGGTSGIAYSADNKYTSTMILKAISNALDKCTRK